MEPLNREQRRHPEKIQEHPEHEEPKERPDEQQLGADRMQDDFSVRAKNTGHRKKTADKWNQ
jgi:hypothetical protein